MFCGKHVQTSALHQMGSTLKEIQFVTPKSKYKIFYYNIWFLLGPPMYLSQAFACTEHNILMDKLHQYAVHGIPHKLIKSYFRSRPQQCKVTHVAKQSTERICVKLPSS
jgi:hypothetical protein